MSDDTTTTTAPAEPTTAPTTTTDTTPAPEAPTDAAPPPPAETPRVERELRRIAEREAAWRKAQKSIRAERDAMAAELAQLRQTRDLVALAKTDPVAFLDQAGIDYESLQKQLLSGRKPKPPEARALEEVQAKLDAIEKQRAEQESTYQQRVIAQRLEEDRQSIVTHVAAAADVPALRQLASVFGEAEVAAEIQSLKMHHFRATGEVLDNAAASRTLEGRATALLTRLREALAAPDGAANQAPDGEQAAPAAASPGQTVDAPRAAPRTITRRHGSTSTPSSKPALTDAERAARAKARLAGLLR